MAHTANHGDGPRAEQWKEISASISANFRAHWNARPIANDGGPPDFSVARADGVAVSKASMPPLTIVNEGSSSPVPVYYVTRVSQESVLVLEDRHPLRLAPDDLIVLGSDMRCRWTTKRPYSTSTIHIEEDLFKSQLADPDRLLGRRLSFPYFLDDVLGHTMDAALAMQSAGEFGNSGQKLVLSLLNVLALVPTFEVADRCDPSRALGLRSSQIKTFIRRNHTRPDLSVEAIARHLQITPRYVQMALASEGTSASEFLRTCRLEAAHNVLRSQDYVHLNITQVAFACGFSSSAYFSTEFKRHFGMSPRDYRRQVEAGAEIFLRNE